MPRFNSYLFFDGNCADAMRFYERTLGGKITMSMTHAQSPMGAQASAGNANRIIHASLDIDGGTLMASDTMAGETYHGMKNFALSLVYPTAAEAKRIFDALGEGGKVTMPLAKTFFAESFGMLVDRFGTPWMVGGAMTSS
jgi:PhnB protein